MFFKSKFDLANAANKLLATILANNLQVSASKRDKITPGSPHLAPSLSAVYLLHVQLVAEGRVVLPTAQLLHLATQLASHRLGVGVLVELFDVLLQIVIRFLLFTTSRTHGSNRIIILHIFACDLVNASHVSKHSFS